MKSLHRRIDWSTYTKLFSNVDQSLPTKRRIHATTQVDSVDAEGSCSISSPAQSMNHYAKLTDVIQVVNAVRDRMVSYDEDTGLPLAFQDSIDSLRESIAATVASAIEAKIFDHEDDNDIMDAVFLIENDNENEEIAIDSSTGPSSLSSADRCITHPEIIPYLEAGLEAVYRQNRDLRTAILDAMEQDDIDTSKIILDADLSSPRLGDSSKDDDVLTESEMVQLALFRLNRIQRILLYGNKVNLKQQSEDLNEDIIFLNLRQLIDTPIFYKIMSYIDTLYDLVSGQHDAIDSLLEQILVSFIPASSIKNDDPDMISKSIVQYVLYNITNNINIPVPTAMVHNSRSYFIAKMTTSLF
jgi:hypothetical protein